MSLPTFLRINHPHIIHEIIEGEAILVNLETGSYYSSDQIGAVIWDGIENGMPTEQLVTTITNAYGGESIAIREQVSTFLQQLQDERLVLGDTTPPEKTATVPFRVPEDKPAFVAPVLKKYTEMEDLLLLDPIHDVDDSGWPHRSADAA